MREWLEHCSFVDKLFTNRPNRPQDWRIWGRGRDKIKLVMGIWKVKEKELEKYSSLSILGGEDYHILLFYELQFSLFTRPTQHHKYSNIQIWSDFDRASSLMCGNKMPTRWDRWFLLQILLLAQHVSGTTMPIIRSSRVLYRWLLPVVFGTLVFKLSVWCGADGCVSGLRAATLKLITAHLKNVNFY
jgi:hypothetical protein